MRNNPRRSAELQIDLVKQRLSGRYRKMGCKTCDELLAAFKSKVSVFTIAVRLA
jgi:hypothetical protein